MANRTSINFYSNNAKCFLRCMALTEGRMTKSYMEMLGSKKLTNQLIKENYVKKNRDGSYSSTDKLLKQYKTVFKAPRKFYYNTSISTKHSIGEAKFLSCINKSSLLKADIKTSKELANEHKKLKKTDEYMRNLENYRKEILKEYKSIPNNGDEFILRKADLKLTLDVIISNNPTSPPDFEIRNFPTEDLDKVINKMEYMLHNEEFTKKEEEYFCKAIDKVRYIREQAIERHQEVVSFAVEVITISYSAEAIREKEIYSHITNTDIIYIYEGG